MIGMMMPPRTWVTFASGFKKQKADSDRDDVGNDDDPDEGEGQVEFALRRRQQHIGTGDDALNDKRAEQDRHDDAGRHAERDGR